MVIEVITHIEITFINTGTYYRFIRDFNTGNGSAVIGKWFLDTDIIVASIWFITQRKDIASKVNHAGGNVFFI